MKTYRLTPLDELHLEKKRLREERAISEQRLSYQFQYLQDNWGTMLTKGVLSSVKHKFAETVDTITSGSSSSSLPFHKNRTNPGGAGCSRGGVRSGPHPGARRASSDRCRDDCIALRPWHATSVRGSGPLSSVMRTSRAGSGDAPSCAGAPTPSRGGYGT